MRKGFELLKTRRFDKSINFEDLEKNYNIIIPNLYKLFAETFVLDENCISYDLYLHPEYNDTRYLTYFSYLKKPEIEFSGFNTVVNSILFSKEIENKDNIEYLIIGHNTSGGIALGLYGDKKDIIFLYTPDGYPEEYTKLSENIFEFTRNLEEVCQSENEVDGIQYSKFYKNWGDKVWKVRSSDS